MVAHDLRNPLGLIQGTAQLLLDAELPASQRTQLLESTVRATKQMNRLIQDLLDATRIDGGRLAVELHDVAVGEIVSEVDESFRALAERRNVSWSTRGSDALATVKADRSRVVQALGNLVGNALKFTPARGRVTLATTIDDTEVAFHVSDTGAGIPPASLGHLFEPFWQATTDRRGIGLGLTIARGIAEAHQGRIDVASTPGQGSTFTLVLPRRGVDATSSQTTIHLNRSSHGNSREDR
jgi:signal transduction histidine kinase